MLIRREKAHNIYRLNLFIESLIFGMGFLIILKRGVVVFTMFALPGLSSVEFELITRHDE